MERNAKQVMIVNDIPDYFKDKFIGKGCSGECYLTKNDNQVFKELHNQLIDKFVLKELTYFNSDLVAFPRTIVYKQKIDDNNIVGYMYDYVEGTNLLDVSDNEKISDIINASKNLEKEIRDLSHKGLIIDDIDIIYTKDKSFKLIDTDLYDYTISEEPYYIYLANLRELGNYLMTVTKSTYPYKNYELNEYYKRLIFHGKELPSYIMKYMLEEMNKAAGHKIETLGEYKESHKLIKKL